MDKKYFFILYLLNIKIKLKMMKESTTHMIIIGILVLCIILLGYHAYKLSQKSKNAIVVVNKGNEYYRDLSTATEVKAQSSIEELKQ